MKKYSRNVIWIFSILLLLAHTSAFAAAKILSNKTGKIIPNQYIVVLKQASGARTMDNAQYVSTNADRLAAHAGAAVVHRYRRALPGFVVRANRRQIELLAKDAQVDYIEPDQVMSINDVQSPATWGIDRIDQRDLPLNNTYEHTRTGNGVNVYVIDTGVRITHNDFGGRGRSGFTSINDGRGTDDCNGHGTHVAGTIGGSTYGVAKNATIHAVRVLSCSGSGSNSGVIAGVDWVANNAVRPAVVNMSLGGGNSTALDNAVRNAINQGVFFAVAAGNDNANACSGSPNRVAEAMTVGASTRNDARSSFSNWGSCVNMLAPGSGITSAWSTSNSATNTISGTSMASPHVAGTGALYLEGDPTALPATVFSHLQTVATVDRLSGLRGSPNRLIHTEPGAGGNIAPVANFTHSANLLAVTFTDTSTDRDGTVVGWEWNFGDGNISSNQNPLHSYASTGTYNVTLTVTDDQGARSQSKSQSIAVSDGSNQAPTASFTHTASGLTASFTDTSNDPDGTVSAWFWDFGDGGASNAQNPSHTYAQAGTYKVSLSVRDDRGADSAAVAQDVTVTESTSPCPEPGCEEFRGTLTGARDADAQPNGTYFFHPGGTLQGWLEGPASGADFDLTLRRWTIFGWRTVAASESPTSSEAIRFNARRGYYHWRIFSFSGAGDYTFWMKRP